MLDPGFRVLFLSDQAAVPRRLLILETRIPGRDEQR
ncbi:Uncharacterised protein [uncultured archaeon]|nr:Uncharacterised protein [uncultured archaeon]